MAGEQFGGLKPFTRSEQRVNGKLGIIPANVAAAKKVRDPYLDILDSYYENRAYEHLMDWVQPAGMESHVPLRKRKPLLQYNFAKVLSNRVTGKLVGRNVFPSFNIEDDPDTTDLIRLVIQQSRIKSKIIEPMRRMLNSGSVLVRFAIIDGQYKVEHFLGKYCYPEFDSVGGLQRVEIKYVFEDPNEVDETGKAVLKWFRMDLETDKEIVYDNPRFNPAEKEPIFKIVNEVVHDLGFVQAEWFRTTEESTDGAALIEDLMGFIDALNYSLSQSDQAISYNQDPQLLIKGMDEDEIDTLIRSAMKAWNLGKEGDASVLEAGLTGPAMAQENRDRLLQRAQDVARVVLLDPEKIVGSAQSAKAMEVLHGPMIDMINELRPQIEYHLKNLVEKMTVATLVVNRQGGLKAITIPPGFTPKSFNIVVTWPEIFPLTLEDLQKKVGVASSAATANIISRETALRFIAKDFGVEDIEEEVSKVNAQPIFNPFGAF